MPPAEHNTDNRRHRLTCCPSHLTLETRTEVRLPSLQTPRDCNLVKQAHSLNMQLYPQT